jgi:hypothetical protein
METMCHKPVNGDSCFFLPIGIRLVLGAPRHYASIHHFPGKSRLSSWYSLCGEKSSSVIVSS